MLYMTEVKMIIEADNANEADKAVKAMMDHHLGEESQLLDYKVQSHVPTNVILEDSFANEVSGAAFLKCLIHSEKNHGYWSNKYGWTNSVLATRFDVTMTNEKEITGADDALLMYDV